MTRWHNETPVENKVDLQLQDIIEINAPSNEILNEKQFVILIFQLIKLNYVMLKH